MKNIRPFDRFFRLALGIVALLLGYFWLAAPLNLVAYAVAAILILTALFRFCPLYRLLGISPVAANAMPSGLLGKGLKFVSLAALLFGGAYASDFFSRKFFLEDFNAMNGFYKQTLFLTGKDQRNEAIANYDKLIPAFAGFTAKYTAYQPHAIKGDTQLTTDFAAVGKMLTDVEPLVRTGDLHEAHLALEKVRPVFQEMFKRNGFSMLAVALVDFHDAMETVFEPAAAKDAAKAIALYPGVSDKLKAVEAEVNDEEIQAIRKALDDVLATAQAGTVDALPAKADALKTSFVKVYLKRG